MAGTHGPPTNPGTPPHGTHGIVRTTLLSTGDMIPGITADGMTLGITVLIITSAGMTLGTIVRITTMDGTADGMTPGSMIPGTMILGTTADGMVATPGITTAGVTAMVPIGEASEAETGSTGPGFPQPEARRGAV